MDCCVMMAIDALHAVQVPPMSIRDDKEGSGKPICRCRWIEYLNALTWSTAWGLPPYRRCRSVPCSSHDVVYTDVRWPAVCGQATTGRPAGYPAYVWMLCR